MKTKDFRKINKGLTKNQRILVEQMKDYNIVVKILLGSGQEAQLFISEKETRHQIALAVQSACIRKNQKDGIYEK